MAKKKDSIDHGDRNSESEPDFNDPEDFVDDIADEELCGDILRLKPKESDGVENVIVVDGIPQVGGDKLEKLKTVIRKIFLNIGPIISDEFPVNSENVSKGYCFFEFGTPEVAATAVASANDIKFDKSHTFIVNLFSDFEKYEAIPEDWHTPEPQPYKNPGNLWYYLMEPDAFDQYCIVNVGIPKGGVQANDVQVYLNSRPEPTQLLNRAGGTDSVAMWSPQGTYLATFHNRGVALWGGEAFDRINRFAHVNVEYIDFSPSEKYLVTFAPKLERQYENPEVLIVWDIRTGAKKRSFSEIPKTSWPILKWSHDDRFFAKLGNEAISIYETPSFRLHDNKSLRVTDLRDFSWSPSENIIAYWVAENVNVPARVVLVEFPSRVEIRTKNLFSVADCRMHWQKSGEHLCVKVDRYSKAKKEKAENKYSGIYYNFEIFHMKEKGIPVDSVCEFRETITAFAWEPIGNKFALIHGEPANISVSFYAVRKGDLPQLVKKFEKKKFNTLFWAPQGQFIVLAMLKVPDGPLEFIDTSDFTVMSSFTPDITTDVAWDPTGRYVATAISSWTGKVADTGYTLFNFQGKMLRKEQVSRFGNLFWRPRPPSLLSNAQIKEIKKNLKKYSPKFEEQDKIAFTKVSKELLEKRERILSSWREYRARKEEAYKAQKSKRLLLRNHIDTDELDADKSSMHEEVIETLIKEDTFDE